MSSTSNISGKKKKVGRFYIGKIIGEGTFGKVKYGEEIETGKRVAVKIIERQRITREGLCYQIKNEIAILKKIKHKNIVNLLDVMVSRTRIYLILELVTGGELFYKIAEQGRFSEEQARHYFQQLLLGVHACHCQKVCHRDLKPENLLLAENDVLKISDFGLSGLRTEDEEGMFFYTTCGTPNYVSPEVLNSQDNNGYNGVAADIWSCGVILYVFVTGFLPFEDHNIENLFKKIMNADFKYPPWVSDQLICLIDKILVPDPNKRISMTDLMKDPWVGLEDHVNSYPRITVGKEDLVWEEVVEDGNLDPNITAFDLISMTGAFDFSRMLQQNPKEVVHRYTKFTSHRSADTAYDCVKTALNGMRNIEFRAHHKSYKFTAAARTNKGIVAFTVQIFKTGQNAHVVDFKKGKGDLIGFWETYRVLKEHVVELLHEKSDTDSDGKASGPPTPTGTPPPHFPTTAATTTTTTTTASTAAATTTATPATASSAAAPAHPPPGHDTSLLKARLPSLTTAVSAKDIQLMEMAAKDTTPS
eukprot:GCRY01001427.1.p1 GENE.GCRY01001427.1~~GCRY01001427.1.p1  ORF type:complete len:531 (-),score=118.76 GCRY01001427.1:260-1852(-)